MIASFRHKDLQRLYLTGNAKGIVPAHVRRILVRLERLELAQSLAELPPEWKCHPLHDDLEGFYAIAINGPWRLIFRFEDGAFCDVDYRQYH